MNRLTKWEKTIENVRRSYTSSTEIPPIEAADDEPKVTCRHGLPHRFVYRKSNGEEGTGSFRQLEKASASIIRKILLMIKWTTNKSDKLALNMLQEMYNRQAELEASLDTQRVKNNPKRIVVYLGVKNISLLFKDIQESVNVTYLENVLKKFEDPNPTPENALEQEAVDLLKARLKQLRKERAERVENERKRKMLADLSIRKQSRRK